MGSVQRGGMVCRNDNGTLERVDGTNTYVGSATLDNGKVVTKRFRGTVPEEPQIIERWEKWQGRKDKSEEDMATTKTEIKAIATKKEECPFSGNECGVRCPLYSKPNQACALMLGGVGLYNMSCNLMRLDMTEPLELLALAVAESQTPKQEAKAPVKEEPTAEQGVAAFFEGKSFLEFINLTSKKVHGEYKRFCTDRGYPMVKESELSKLVLERYSELKKKPMHGGMAFIAA